MRILIAYAGKIPVRTYGGTQRSVWCLGKELTRLGHKVTYLVAKDSYCDFADVIWMDPYKKIADQIPASTDLVHFNYDCREPVQQPYLITIRGNCNDFREFDRNTVFISKDHAARFGSESYVYNGLDWDDYGKPDFTTPKKYYHFLGNAAWHVKNVKGAVHVIRLTRQERLKVLGGYRLNFNMGLRFTLSPRVSFCGMVGGEKKNELLRHSKGLLFPVRWHEPFGLAVIESLYFGCPVFGTPYGSLPELVQKEMGFLSNNAEELAGAIENNHCFSPQRCHDYVVEEFSSRKLAASYLKVYEKVLNGETLNPAAPRLVQKQEEKFLRWA